MRMKLIRIEVLLHAYLVILLRYGDDMTKCVWTSVAIACTIFAWLVIRG